MKTSKELLSSLLKTTQMGQIGIRSCLSSPMTSQLRHCLQQQLREYDTIETEAHSIASQRGWEVRELDPAVRVMTDAMTRMKLVRGNQESKIANMMILGNTRGMIKGIRNLHELAQEDSQLQTLSQKLLDCEKAGIRQMQSFL